ncbi:MAG: MBL fold metallo-hydrolase [Thermodesulfobacteriota bacterium]|nr:MBL fold metallo-hydrolase [Thermodesulfobacteriota bacterium]
MELTILGSGGCSVIPKPLCGCPVCEEARRKGAPYERTGPSAFIHDENLLIDTPAEIASQLNRSQIDQIDYLLFTHLDPDHVEGSRVVEHITLDFRTWQAYPGQQIQLVLPEKLNNRLKDIQSIYGPLIDYYEEQGFVKRTPFQDTIEIGELKLTGIPIDRGSQWSYIYVFEKRGRKMVYAPCDIKPFPEDRAEVLGADLLVIQPGIFEDGLKHGFIYGEDHISRRTLYTFEETLALARRIRADHVLFIHLEEYWNRSHDDYVALEATLDNARFAYDGMHVTV